MKREEYPNTNAESVCLLIGAPFFTPSLTPTSRHLDSPACARHLARLYPIDLHFYMHSHRTHLAAHSYCALPSSLSRLHHAALSTAALTRSARPCTSRRPPPPTSCPPIALSPAPLSRPPRPTTLHTPPTLPQRGSHSFRPPLYLPPSPAVYFLPAHRLVPTPPKPPSPPLPPLPPSPVGVDATKCRERNE